MTTGDAARGSFQRVPEVSAGGLQGGDEAEPNSCTQRDQERESQHSEVESDLLGARNGWHEAPMGSGCQSRGSSPLRDREAQPASDARHENAFGKQLANDT